MAEMELRPDSHGKVRDIYDCGDSLLMVASDRISAYDFILPDEIPHKGEILTRISAFWFERFADLIPNHMISCNVADLPEEFKPYADYLAGRSMLVKKAQTVPIECIVRGYLTGSGKKTYDEDGTVCGIKLPAGLTEASKLPEPIFTPSTKAELGDHDENISFERRCDIVGTEVAEQLRDASLSIYKAAAEYAATRGIIIADTKFEFGFIDGRLTLIDECLTPDSSRFWPADSYEEGKVQPSYDKQYVRDWLRSNWDMTGEHAAHPRRRHRGHLPPLPGGLPDHHRQRVLAGPSQLSSASRFRVRTFAKGEQCHCATPLTAPAARLRATSSGRPKKEAEAVTDKSGDEDKKGFARRSAASAKPSREAAASVHVSSKPKAQPGLFGGDKSETKEEKRERKRRERVESDLRTRAYDLVLRSMEG